MDKIQHACINVPRHITTSMQETKLDRALGSDKKNRTGHRRTGARVRREKRRKRKGREDERPSALLFTTHQFYSDNDTVFDSPQPTQPVAPLRRIVTFCLESCGR